MSRATADAPDCVRDGAMYATDAAWVAIGAEGADALSSVSYEYRHLADAIEVWCAAAGASGAYFPDALCRLAGLDATTPPTDLTWDLIAAASRLTVEMTPDGYPTPRGVDVVVRAGADIVLVWRTSTEVLLSRYEGRWLVVVYDHHHRAAVARARNAYVEHIRAWAEAAAQL